MLIIYTVTGLYVNGLLNIHHRVSDKTNIYVVLQYSSLVRATTVLVYLPIIMLRVVRQVTIEKVQKHQYKSALRK